jgi:hypothetical protein
MPRYRWSDGPQDFTGPLPRDGATLRSPIVDDAGRTRARERHFAQEEEGGSRASRTSGLPRGPQREKSGAGR